MEKFLKEALGEGFRLFSREEVESLIKQYDKELRGSIRYMVVDTSTSNTGALSETALDGLSSAIKATEDRYKINWCLNRAYDIGATEAVNKIVREL